MRILQIMNRVPYPLNDGGSIGMHYYIEGYLNAGASLSVFAMNTSRDHVALEILPAIYEKLSHFKVIDVNTDIKVLGALNNMLFEKSSYNVNRFNQKTIHEELVTFLKQHTFDIIHLDSLFVTDYIPTIRAHSEAKIVLRQHNIEFTIWERLSKTAKNLLKKWYFNLLAQRLKAHELKYINQYDLVLPISQQDAAVFKSLSKQTSPMWIHPFGIQMENGDVNKVSFDLTHHKVKELKLYHIGAMDWLPNQESVQFLLEEIVPEVLKSTSQVSFHIAGRSMQKEWFGYAQERVEIYGEVPSAAEFEADKQVLIVPLKSGGGVRIKIFQAMAQGKIVITSPIGLEGIEAINGKEVMIAKTVDDFKNAILFLQENPQERVAMSKAAQQLVAEKYNAANNFKSLLQHYQSLLKSE